MALAAVVAVAAACGSGTSGVVTHPGHIELTPAPPGGAWTVSVIVVNNAHSRQAITVDVDGRRAVDATFPAASAGVTSPAAEYRFALADGAHELVAVHAGERARLSVPVTGGKPVWVVVQDYEPGVPLEAKLYSSRPGFG